VDSFLTTEETEITEGAWVDYSFFDREFCESGEFFFLLRQRLRRDKWVDYTGLGFRISLGILDRRSLDEGGWVLGYFVIFRA
jgi:hypothetical protein